ncbi:MAG: mechanosensitive ion channel domain-containing protein [Planctomycetaceae bacterium]
MSRCGSRGWKTCRPLRWLTCLAIVLAGVADARSQMTAADGGSSIKADLIRSEIESVEATDLDAETTKKIVDQYKSALTELTRLDEIVANDARYREELTTVAERAQQLAAQRLAVLRSPIEDVKGKSLADLEIELASRTANVALLKRELNDLEARREKRTARKEEIRRIKEEAPARRTELQRQIDAAPPAGEPERLTEARRMETRLRLEAFDRSLPVLDLELAVAAAEEKAELLRLGQELKKAELAREEAAVGRLTNAANALRQKEAERQIKEAERESLFAHPLLAGLANQNRLAAKEVASYPAKIARVEHDTSGIRRELELQAAKFRDIQEKIRLVGLTQPIGANLREQRMQFPDLDELDRQLAERRETINEAQMATWQYSDELNSLLNASDYVQSLFAGPAAHDGVESDPSALTAEQLEELMRDAAKLLAMRRDLLSDLKRASQDYNEALVALDTTDVQYLNASREYLHYINERILWTRSADPLSVDLVRDDVKSRTWLLSAGHWNAVLKAGMADPVENPFAFWPTLLTVLTLFYLRLHIRPRLRALGGNAGKRGFLRYGPTAQAAVMTVLSAVTGPAALMFVSWRLAEADDPTGFVRAVAAAIESCAAILFPIEILREACRHQGLAESHFAWPPRAVGHLRRVLTWMKTAGLPVAFLAVLAHYYKPFSGGTPTERLLFIGAMALAAVTLHRLLSAQGELVKAFQAEQPRSLFTRFHRLWYAIGVALPIVFAGLSALGYHYSATQVAHRLLWTVWLAAGLVLIRAMAVRWVVLSRRRLLLDQAYQRRAAEETQEAAGTLVPPVIEETDVAKTTAQTRKLVDLVVLGVAVMFLGMIWADTLPAFSLLDRPLWDVERVVQVEASTEAGAADGTVSIASPPTDSAAGESSIVSITTLDLAVAMLVALFTFLASRNLPGLMEMSVLNRLPLDNATRYAATRLACYAIVFIGVMMASNRLGLRWQNIQWLVAALTVGLGFGLQEVFANFVSGLIILFERPVRVGDIVTIDGVTGVVSRIRMRATTITDWDRKEFIVPNKEFITGRVLNWTLSDAVNRITVTIGIAYGSDVHRATKILLRICEEYPVLLTEPAPSASLEGFADSSLTLVLRCFLPTFESRGDVVHGLHMRIDEEFRKADIEMAFPQRDLHIRSIDGLTLPFPITASAVSDRTPAGRDSSERAAGERAAG